MAIYLQNICQIMKNMNFVSFKRNSKALLCSQHNDFNNEMCLLKYQICSTFDVRIK